MKYEWIICALADAEDKLQKMRDDGWHPSSHSIWYDGRNCMTMASFIFKKKVDKDVKKFVKQRVAELIQQNVLS